MSPTVVHVAPHPDDEALGCPGALLHLFDRGWNVVSVLASLGFPDQWERRRAEFEEASRRAQFVPVLLDPPLDISLPRCYPGTLINASLLLTHCSSIFFFCC